MVQPALASLRVSGDIPLVWVDSDLIVQEENLPL